MAGDIAGGARVLHANPARRPRADVVPDVDELNERTWSIIEPEFSDSVDRALAAGARAPLSLIGVGMTGIVFCDGSAAYKVARDRSEGNLVESEAEWLEAARQVRWPAKYRVAQFVRYDRQHAVLVRECVHGRVGTWGWQGGHKLWELHHHTLRDLMMPHGWSAPEFKEDSYVITEDGTAVLVDASMGHRRGHRQLDYIADVLEGRRQRRRYETDEHFAYEVRAELDDGMVAPEAAADMLARLQVHHNPAPPDRGHIVIRQAERGGTGETIFDAEEFFGELPELEEVDFTNDLGWPDPDDEDFDRHRQAQWDKLYRAKGSPNRLSWFGDEGHMVWLGWDQVHAMQGNIFDPQKIVQLVAAIRRGNAELEPPTARLSIIHPSEVDDSFQAWRRGELFDSYGATRAYEKDDVGVVVAQLRDGNHRAFAAQLAGEHGLWVYVVKAGDGGPPIAHGLKLNPGKPPRIPCGCHH